MQIQKFNWIIRRAGLYNAGPVYGFGHCNIGDTYDASAPRSIQLPSTSTSVSADPAPGTARRHTQFRPIQPLPRRRQIEKLSWRQADVAGLRRGRADGGGADDLKRRNRRRDCGWD